MHTRACTHTHLRMHKPQHANAHSHTCTTRIQRRYTYTCTHNTYAHTSCRVGGRKGIPCLWYFWKAQWQYVLEWVLGSSGKPRHKTLWFRSMGYTIRALQQLQNEFLKNYTNCMRYKYIYAQIISEGSDWPPKGGCFSNVHWAWAPMLATVKCGSKWYYPQQLSLTVANVGAHAELPAAWTPLFYIVSSY